VQKGVYRNDRQVREKHVFHAIDRANPRAEIEVEPIEAQQQEMAA
jgi:Holliday junction resolvase RusA-like endonuclease